MKQISKFPFPRSHHTADAPELADQNPGILIYLVSLDSDLERREALQRRFKATYRFFQPIEAVDGRVLQARDYYEKMLPGFLHGGNMMSPTEVGCALSHVKALTLFLESDRERALILEDDVIGDDTSIAQAAAIATKMTENSLVLCGSQEGLNRRYKLGRAAHALETYRVARFSYEFAYGTFCYIVTRKSAREILVSQARCLAVADHWDVLFKKSTTQIYFQNIFSHAGDMAVSHIEEDREVFRKSGLLAKMLTRDVVWKLFRRGRLELQRAFALLCGYRNLT